MPNPRAPSTRALRTRSTADARVTPYETRSRRAPNTRTTPETLILATITGNDAGATAAPAESSVQPPPPSNSNEGSAATAQASATPGTSDAPRRDLGTSPLSRAVDRAIGHLARQLAANEEFLSEMDMNQSIREVGHMFSRQRTNYFVAVRYILSSILALPMDDPLEAIMRVASSLDRYIFDPLIIPPIDTENDDSNAVPAFLREASRGNSGQNQSSTSQANSSNADDAGDLLSRFTVRVPDAFPIVRVRGFNIPGLRQQYEESLKWRKWFDVVRDRAWRERQKNGKSSKDNECPVCLDTLEGVVKLQPITCIHVFHEDCIDNWIKKNPAFPHARCPVCRGDFMSKETLDRKKRQVRGNRESGETSDRPFAVAFRIFPSNV